MATAAHPPHRVLQQGELRHILDAHKSWLTSDGNQGQRADLSNVDLADADLAGTNLCRADLSGANLSGADLSHALLDHACAPRTNLSEADLSQASLINTNLTWANLAGADLAGANLTDATLSDAELTDANLSGADFSGAELDGADLIGAEMDGTIMIGADMSGARFDINDGDMDDAFDAAADDTLSDHHLDDTPVSELPDADLTEAEPVKPTPPNAAQENTANTAKGDGTATRAPQPTPPPSGGPEHREAQLAARLAAHQVWLHSNGQDGQRADLTNLSPIPLADLAGADLRHASLGTHTGLHAACQRVAQMSRRVGHGIAALVAACIYAVLTLGSAVMLPGAPVKLPLFGTHIHALLVAVGIPALLFIGYLLLHGAIRNLVHQAARLPDFLPNGTRRSAIAGPLGTHIGGNVGTPFLWRISVWLVRLLAWGAVPCTLAFYWGAFLPIATSTGSAVLALLTAASAGIGMTALVRSGRR